MFRRALIGVVLAAALVLAVLVLHARQTGPRRAPTPPGGEIILRVSTSPIPTTIRTATFACGDRLGGPPPGSSLQTPRGQAGLIVLYLPKQCLLDPTVTSG